MTTNLEMCVNANTIAHTHTTHTLPKMWSHTTTTNYYYIPSFPFLTTIPAFVDDHKSDHNVTKHDHNRKKRGHQFQPLLTEHLMKAFTHLLKQSHTPPVGFPP